MKLSRVLGRAAGIVGDQIQKNAEFIRQEESKKKDYLFTKALENQAKVKQARSKLMNEYSVLRDMGVDERRLKRYMRNNPKAVSYMAGIVAQNPGKLDGEDLNTFFKINEENPDITESLEDLVDQAFVQYSDVEIPKSPQEKEKTFLQRLFSGVDTDEINKNVAMAEILPGVTGAEVIAGMDQFGQLRSGTGAMRPDYSVLGEEKYDNRMLLTARTDMIEEYDDYLKRQIEATKDDPKKSKTFSTLTAIENQGTTNRLNSLIKLNPSIAQRYFNEPYGSELFDPERGIFSSTTSALLSPREEGEVETTGAGLGAGDTGTETGTTPKAAPGVSIPKSLESEITLNNDGVPVFESMEEAQAANDKGLTGPAFIKGEGVANLTADITDTSSLAGIADASGMSLEDMTASKAEIARRQTKESAKAIGGTTGTVADWFDRNILGRSVGSFNDLASTITSGFAWGFDQAGLESLADGLYTASYDMSEGAENMRKMGFFENALNSVQSGEYTESEWIEAAAEFVVENMPDQPGKPTVKDIIEGKEKGAKIKEVLASSYDSIANLEGIPAIPQNLEIPKRSEWTSSSWPTKNGRKVTDDNVLFDMLVYDKQNKTYPDSDYLDDGFTQEQLDRVKKEVDAAFKGSDLDAALDRAPKHIEKLGSQATDAWRKLTAEVKDFSFSDISLSTPDEENPMLTLIEGLVGEQPTEVSEEKPANVATRASDTPAYKQLQELLQERIALAKRPPKARKKKEETIKKKAEKILIDLGDMSGAPGFRTEEVSLLSLILADELPERIVEYNPRAIGTVGSRDLGLRDTTDDVRPPRSKGADVQTKTRAPLGDTRSGAPDMELPSSLTVEQMTTRGKKATPSGLMSPPDRGYEPKVGESVLLGTIKRLHGSGSKVSKDFAKKVSSGTIKAADVTRLINSTKKLPKTSSRQTLLESLYELRDTLNKR